MAGFSLHRDEGKDGRAEGIWTPYGPELTEQEAHEGKLREAYQIRPLRPKDMDHFRKMATPKNKWSQNQRVTEPDPEQYNEFLYDHIIVDWQGVYLDEAKTEEAPCTLANKLLLAGMSLDRANFVVVQASLYANDDDARQQAEQARFRRTRAVPAGSPEA